MPEKNLSDKELIKIYLKEKGINQHAFNKKVGFSSSFLNADATITLDNLRKIIFHPEFEDLNIEALLNRAEKK